MKILTHFLKKNTKIIIMIQNKTIEINKTKKKEPRQEANPAPPRMAQAQAEPNAQAATVEDTVKKKHKIFKNNIPTQNKTTNAHINK